MSNKWQGNKFISYGNNIVVKILKPIETGFINSSKWNFENISSSMRLNYKYPGTSNEEKIQIIQSLYNITNLSVNSMVIIINNSISINYEGKIYKKI